MKKAKIILAAVAVIGVVGGALAFKARETQSVFVHDPADARVSACTLQVSPRTLLPNANFITQTRASIAATTAGCPIVNVYQGE